MAAVRKAGDRVHQERLSERRSATGLALEVDGRCHVHEWQRHEFSETAGALVKVSGGDDVAGPVERLLDGAEHDRHIRCETDAVGGFVCVEPFLSRDLVRTDDRADAVVEDLRRCTWERSQTDLHQSAKVVLQRFAEAFGSLCHLERSETVDVNAGCCFGDRTADVDVIVPIEVRVDAALQRHLGRAEGLCLGCAARDVFEGEQVRLSSQVERERAFGEAAESTFERADVGVVDVAVVNPRDRLAHRRHS